MSGSELPLGLLVHFLLHARKVFAPRKPNLHVSLQAYDLASRALMTDLGELGEYIIELLVADGVRETRRDGNIEPLRHAFSVVSALPIRSMRLHRCDSDWKHINARGGTKQGGRGAQSTIAHAALSPSHLCCNHWDELADAVRKVPAQVWQG